MADLECELPKHISDPVILGSAGGREGDATQNEPKPRPHEFAAASALSPSGIPSPKGYV